MASTSYANGEMSADGGETLPVYEKVSWEDKKGITRHWDPDYDFNLGPNVLPIDCPAWVTRYHDRIEKEHKKRINDKLIKSEMKKLVARNHRVFDLWNKRDELVERFESRKRGERQDDPSTIEKERKQLANVLRELEQLRTIRFHPILGKTFGFEAMREELRSKHLL